jgi:hypothetical protein
MEVITEETASVAEVPWGASVMRDSTAGEPGGEQKADVGLQAISSPNVVAGGECVTTSELANSDALTIGGQGLVSGSEPTSPIAMPSPNFSPVVECDQAPPTDGDQQAQVPTSIQPPEVQLAGDQFSSDPEMFDNLSSMAAGGGSAAADSRVVPVRSDQVEDNGPGGKTSGASPQGSGEAMSPPTATSERTPAPEPGNEEAPGSPTMFEPEEAAGVNGHVSIPVLASDRASAISNSELSATSATSEPGHAVDTEITSPYLSSLPEPEGGRTQAYIIGMMKRCYNCGDETRVIAGILVNAPAPDVPSESHSTFLRRRKASLARLPKFRFVPLPMVIDALIDRLDADWYETYGVGRLAERERDEGYRWTGGGSGLTNGCFHCDAMLRDTPILDGLEEVIGPHRDYEHAAFATIDLAVDLIPALEETPS